MKFPTFLVGGAVRDTLMGLPVKDNDYVVVAPSFEAMKEALLADGCKIFVEKPEFLTIRANHPTLGAVDFACARKDGTYTDGRHPDSTSIAATLEEDLARRDFTCNAMAVDVVTGEVVDPFGGKDDIHHKILKAVGSPLVRLNEDKLRAFRALRFTVQKKFQMNGSLIDAIRVQTMQDFDSVSTERIREELFKMFVVDWFKSFVLLSAFPILRGVIDARGIWFKPTTEVTRAK